MIRQIGVSPFLKRQIIKNIFLYPVRSRNLLVNHFFKIAFVIKNCTCMDCWVVESDTIKKAAVVTTALITAKCVGFYFTDVTL